MQVVKGHRSGTHSKFALFSNKFAKVRFYSNMVEGHIDLVKDECSY